MHTFSVVIATRNRQALLLSIVLPVAILFITGAGGGRRQVLDPGYLIGLSITYGLMASGLFGYPMAVARDRESGVFQRMRVTPVPMWTVSASRIAVQLVLSLVMSLVVLGLGGVRHHLTFGLVNWLLVLAVSLLGAAVFLAIGQAVVGLTTTSGQVNAFSRVLFALLLVVGLIGSSGLLGMGMFVDRQMARGVRDAHFRFAVWLSLTIALCGAIGFSSSSIALFFLFYTVLKTLAPIGGMASASIQIVTPNELRGTVSAIYLFVVTLLGAGTGPTVVATCTEFIFHDSAKVGLAMALTCVVLGLFAAACCRRLGCCRVS